MTVIKFYETGWNYIFDVESIKAMRLSVEEVSEKYHAIKGNRVFVTGIGSGKILIDNIERDVYMDFMDFLEKFISKKFPNQCFDGYHIHLEKDFIEKVIHDPKHSYAYINLLIYGKNEHKVVLVFNKPGYIMDQSTGGTIEKIHGY